MTRYSDEDAVRVNKGRLLSAESGMLNRSRCGGSVITESDRGLFPPSCPPARFASLFPGVCRESVARSLYCAVGLCDPAVLWRVYRVVADRSARSQQGLGRSLGRRSGADEYAHASVGTVLRFVRHAVLARLLPAGTGRDVHQFLRSSGPPRHLFSALVSAADRWARKLQASGSAAGDWLSGAAAAGAAPGFVGGFSGLGAGGDLFVGPARRRSRQCRPPDVPHGPGGAVAVAFGTRRAGLWRDLGRGAAEI